MIIPQNGQTILSFSAIRFLDAILPTSQIDKILSGMHSISQRAISSEIRITSESGIKSMSDFGYNLLPSEIYSAYDGTTKGYSQPKLMGYLTLTHASSIDADDISMISPQIESYVNSADIDVSISNDVWSAVYPHLQLIPNYNSLTIDTISKILTTLTLEDKYPSGISMINLLYSYEFLNDIMHSILNSNVFDEVVGGNIRQVSFSRHIYNSVLQTSFSTITSDLTNFISTDTIFYENLTSRMLSIVGIPNASIGHHNNLKITTRNALNSYFTDINSPLSYINFVSDNLDLIIVDIIAKYSELMQSQVTRSVLDNLAASGLISQLNIDEQLTIQNIYSKYVSLYSNIILNMESICSGVSMTSLDLLNTHIHLFSGLFRSMRIDIDSIFSQYITLPKGIPIDYPNTESDVSSGIVNFLSTYVFSTSDVNNLKIANAAIAAALTSNFEKYVTGQLNQSSFSSSVLQPILNETLSTVNISSSMSSAKLTESVVDAIISEFNEACWNRTPDVLRAYHPILMASMDVSSISVMPDVQSFVNSLTKQHSNAGYSSTIISQAISISIFNVAMNAGLDSFSI